MLKTSRKNQISDTAAQLFREKGYAASSVRALARKVGIEPASIYSHVSSKEELLNDICFSMADKFFERLSKAIDTNDDAETILKNAIKGHILVITEDLDKSAVFFHDWKYLSEPMKSDFQIMRSNYESEFKKIISKGIEQGVFKENDVSFVVLTIFSALNWTNEWYVSGKSLTPEMIADKLSNLILNGIKNK